MPSSHPFARSPAILTFSLPLPIRHLATFLDQPNRFTEESPDRRSPTRRFVVHPDPDAMPYKRLDFVPLTDRSDLAIRSILSQPGALEYFESVHQEEANPGSGREVCIWGTMPEVSTEQIRMSLESPWAWTESLKRYLEDTAGWREKKRNLADEHLARWEVQKDNARPVEGGRHFIRLATTTAAHALVRAIHRTKPLWALDFETQAQVLGASRTRSAAGIRGWKQPSGDLYREVWARVVY